MDAMNELVQVFDDKLERPQMPSPWQCVITLAAGLRRLSAQAHLVHLNYEAPNFLQIHEFFGTQYLAHLDQFDKIAEHVRAADILMPLQTDQLECGCIEFQEPASYEPEALLLAYVVSIEAVADYARWISPMAEEMGAIDLVDTLGALYGELRKASWFVKSTLR